MRETMTYYNKLAVAVYFTEVVLLGNFMLLNLFLAVLLNNVDIIEQNKAAKKNKAQIKAL
jgi:hypothetical protein